MKTQIINQVLGSNVIELTFYHIGTPAWTSEIWTRIKGVFVQTGADCQNCYLEATGEKKNNHDMVSYLKKINKSQEYSLKCKN